MRRLLVLFFIYVFFSSCGKQHPKGIIPKESMISFLTDFHLANAYTSSISGDSISKIASVYKAVYKKYDTDSIGVRKSLSYYTEKPDELEAIYKEVDANLVLLQKVEEKRLNRIKREDLRKAKLKEVLAKRKAKYASDRLKMLKGKYDFGSSSYYSPIETYLKAWKKKSIKKADTLKTDSLRKKMLLKKEQSANDLPTKRIR